MTKSYLKKFIRETLSPILGIFFAVSSIAYAENTVTTSTTTTEQQPASINQFEQWLQNNKTATNTTITSTTTTTTPRNPRVPQPLTYEQGQQAMLDLASPANPPTTAECPMTMDQ